jgi:hypothetical protein
MIVDGILSEVIHKKGNLYKVLNHGETKESFIVKHDTTDTFAHGTTLEQARESLAFKLMSRDVTQFEGMPLDTVKDVKNWALVYRAITGACESGTEYFINKQSDVKPTYTLKEILELVEGQYGSQRFKQIVLKEKVT